MIPIRTNIWPRRTPYANYAIIAITAVVFYLTYDPHYVYIYGQRVLVTISSEATFLKLFPKTWRAWQFVSYAFLHADFMHILGNMFFLYLFGNNVNDRLGHVRYIILYLISAVLSGAAHVVLNQGANIPLVGASGAVAAITGAYLVLFPKSLITVLYWIIFLIGTVDIRAIWFIIFKMIILDNWLGASQGHVAYDAHLAGYAAGILGMLVLLRIRWVKRDGYDLLLMIEQWSRRREYRDMVADGYDPFLGEQGGGRKTIQSEEVPKTPEQKRHEERVSTLRHEISQWLSQRNLPTAAERYMDLMRLDDQQILPRQSLLDIANQLASEKRYREASQAYESLLSHYSSYEQKEQVELMLGLIYARYLGNPKKATEVLHRALPRLTQLEQQSMCRSELERLSRKSF